MKFANSNNISLLLQQLRAKIDNMLSRYTSKEEFDNLKIGGANLLTNSKSLEVLYVNAGTKVQNAYEDFTALYIDKKSASGVFDFLGWQDISVSSQESIILSFYAKGSGNVKVLFSGGAIDCAENTSSEGGQNFNTNGEMSVPLQGDWKKFWVLFKLKSSSTTQTNKNLTFRIDGGNEAYICAPKLERGNKATEWTPRYNDGVITDTEVNDLISRIFS